MFRFGDPGGRIYTALGTSNANVLAHWTTLLNSAATLSIQSAGGRLTGTCLRFNIVNSNNFCQISKTLDNQVTLGLAFAIKIGMLPTSGPIIIAAFEDAGTFQISLRLNTDGTLQVLRGGSVGGSGGEVALTGGTSSVSLSLNVWTHLELKVTINNSTGTVELRKNGVAIIGPLTSLNTRATANNSANAVRIGFLGNPGIAAGLVSGTFDFDDIIVYDAQTTDANGFSDIHDFIGDCALTWLLPTGAGTTTQFTPDSGSNYARVNEATPDGDTSYVESSTTTNIDTYAMADLPGTASSVKSVASVHYMRKTDTGTRGIKAELRAGGGNTAHATEQVLSTSYLYYFSNWGQNPNNGSATNWTPTNVNSVEAGQNLST